MADKKVMNDADLENVSGGWIVEGENNGIKYFSVKGKCLGSRDTYELQRFDYQTNAEKAAAYTAAHFYNEDLKNTKRIYTEGSTAFVDVEKKD